MVERLSRLLLGVNTNLSREGAVMNAPSLLRLVLLLASGHQLHLVAIELPCGMEASAFSQYGRRHLAAQLACCPRFCLLGCTGVPSPYTLKK